MIRFMRSFSLRTTRERPTFHKHAKALTEYLNTRFPETQLQLFDARIGTLHKIYAMADFENLAAFETWWRQYHADSGYTELMEKWHEKYPVGRPVVDGGDTITILDSDF